MVTGPCVAGLDLPGNDPERAAEIRDGSEDEETSTVCGAEAQFWTGSWVPRS